MGAGCSLQRQYRIKYNTFQTMLRQLRGAGGCGTYKNREIGGTLNGHTLRAYFTATDYASNGECFAWLCISINGGEMKRNLNWKTILEDLKK